MHQQIRALQEIVSRKGSGRALTFGMPHVLKVLQMLDAQKYVSRSSLCSSLGVGEGAVKTLIGHLRQAGYVSSARSGTFLTDSGRLLARGFADIIPSECRLPRCGMLPSGANHAILLRGLAGAIRSGVEQRDYAILYGASSAVTLVYGRDAFRFPDEAKECFADDPGTGERLVSGLAPQEGDVIIIVASSDRLTSEVAAKNAALLTLASELR